MRQGPIAALRSVTRFKAPQFDRTARQLGRVACVDDLRELARRALPEGVFDYIDGGAEDERALAANRAAFTDRRLAANVLADVSEVDTTTTILGRRAALPLVLAPTGFTRIADPAGELAVARAAARAGVPYVLSTLSTQSIEAVAGAASGELWFQVYVWRDRALVADMLERAADSGYTTIVITVDTAVLGRRERDVRRGFSLPPSLGLDTLIDGARHPRWVWSLLRSEPIRFANVAASSGSAGDGADPVRLSDYINRQFDQSLSWGDLDWFRDRWAGEVVVKGIQRVDDAKRAADAGVDAIVLSNHGGRQLDDACASLDLIAPAADALGGAIEIYCDGGVRRGSDIVKAVSLGANAVLAGRAYLYGLAAAGEPGVDWVLDHFADGMARTMALCGRSSVSALGSDLFALGARSATDEPLAL